MKSTPKLAQLQRFLIRNSELLSPTQIAEYLHTDATAVQCWMKELGLPEMRPMGPERAFPLVVRRNHDLLSHKEIARLLKMPEELYKKTMMEMDFLDVKVGQKPKGLSNIKACPGRWDKDAATYFKLCSESYFSDYSNWEPLFGFLDELRQVESPTGSVPQDSQLGLRMMYSYTATHGDFLLTGEEFYTDGVLSRLANRGVNAVWMPALLRDLAPSDIFPEFGEDHEIRIENLRKQVEKAKSHGIKLFLYLNEPRFMPEEFFLKHPEARGMEGQAGYYGMCTSEEKVREWLRHSLAFVFSKVPDLGGIILITASENETNCFSHALGGRCKCPRCNERGAAEVLSDTANIFSSTLESIGSKAEIIEWLWGWDFVLGEDKVKDAVGALSPKVTVMVDWARNTRFNLFGKDATIIEYTLAYVQPSDYALGIINTAKSLGRQVMAKCSLVSTVEMNALPYLPVMKNVEELLTALKEYEIDGILGCWIFGAYPGRNMEMLNYLDDASPAESLAAKCYGNGAHEAVRAWKCFSEGMKYFPTIYSVLYHSALNCGPGAEFSLEPADWRFGMVAVPTEQIEKICEPLGADVVIRGFRECAEHFKKGLVYLEAAIEKSSIEEYKEENLRDYGICRASMLHMSIAANHAEFILTRNRWLADQSDENLRSRLIKILEGEVKNKEEMLALSKVDSRIGFEGSVGYLYTPVEIIEQIYNAKLALNQLGS
ncbi:MAG: hypothetical protein ABFD64_00145 [Armatimonadota bacterium]